MIESFDLKKEMLGFLAPSLLCESNLWQSAVYICCFAVQIERIKSIEIVTNLVF